MTGFVTPPAPLRRIEIQLSDRMYERMVQRARARNMPLPVFARLLLEAAWSAHAKPPTGDAALDEAVAHAFDEKPAPKPPLAQKTEPVRQIPPAPPPAPAPRIKAAPAQEAPPPWQQLPPSSRQVLEALARHGRGSYEGLAAGCVPPIAVQTLKVNISKIRGALPPGIRIRNDFGMGYEVDAGLAELRALLQIEPEPVATETAGAEAVKAGVDRPAAPVVNQPAEAGPTPSPGQPARPPGSGDKATGGPPCDSAPAPEPAPAKPAPAALTPGQIKLVRMYRGLDMDLQEIVQVTGFDPELVRACMDAAAPTDRRKRR
jgi:hypothetical protein